MRYILIDGTVVDVNAAQICYSTTVTLQGVEYTSLHLANGEVLTGTLADDD